MLSITEADLGADAARPPVRRPGARPQAEPLLDAPDPGLDHRHRGRARRLDRDGDRGDDRRSADDADPRHGALRGDPRRPEPRALGAARRDGLGRSRGDQLAHRPPLAAPGRRGDERPGRGTRPPASRRSRRGARHRRRRRFRARARRRLGHTAWRRDRDLTRAAARRRRAHARVGRRRPGAGSPPAVPRERLRDPLQRPDRDGALPGRARRGGAARDLGRATAGRSRARGGVRGRGSPPARRLDEAVDLRGGSPLGRHDRRRSSGRSRDTGRSSTSTTPRRVSWCGRSGRFRRPIRRRSVPHSTRRACGPSTSASSSCRSIGSISRAADDTIGRSCATDARCHS